MTRKTLLLAAAILAGLSLPALAERGHGDHGPRGMAFPGPSFSELDTDGNGSVSVEELQNRGAARFASADTDGNGELSADEIVAAAEARMREAATTRADRMISRLDADGNGTLSEDELAARGQARMADRMLSRLDADGDGALSEDEFGALEDRMRDGRGPRGGHGQRDGVK